jgi:hypothetical protein
VNDPRAGADADGRQVLPAHVVRGEEGGRTRQELGRLALLAGPGHLVDERAAGRCQGK